MEVGVREFKQRLSKYLDDVAAGTEIVVTERGRPKVRVVPLTDDGVLSRGIEEGWIRPPLRRPEGRDRPQVVADRRTGDVLDADRG